jgi:hypothetical protein
MPDHTPGDRLGDLREAVESVVEPTAMEQRTPFDELVGRAAGRRQRRHRIAVAGVVAVVGAGLLLARPVTDRLTTPPAQQTAAPATGRLLIQSFAFGTPERGFALVTRCQGPGYRCAVHATLYGTSDGGRNWTAIPSPADNVPGEANRVDAVTPTGGVVLGSGNTRYASPDGGLHWRTLPPRGAPGPAVEAIPAGWSLDTDGTRLSAVDPVTDQVRPLSHQPPGGAAGSSWPPGGGPLVVASGYGTGLRLTYSPDRGRTWRPVPMPAGAHGVIASVLTDPVSERIYLALADDQGRLTSLWRQDHVGATAWVRVPIPPEVSADPNPGTIKSVRMLPDGELLYGLQTPLRTEDGGARTVPVDTIRVYGFTANMAYFEQSVGGTLFATVEPGIQQPQGVMSLLVSTDSGRTWDLRVYRP